MSLLRKKDYTNDTKKVVGKKDNRAVMSKIKLPTDMKTEYSICPRCSKKGYVRNKGFCKLCKFRFTPNKPIVWQNGRKVNDS
jgi:ribosomal protein L37E